MYVLPARFDHSELPGLHPDVVTVDLRGYTPEQFADLVVAKLADLGISQSLSPDEAGRAPPGGVRVSEADPRRLGVHAAISVPGVSDEVPPEYVLRDIDAAEHGVRAQVTAAAQRGGFVLLVGGSSVGKTRCAAEAVKAPLPDWWLAHPAGPDQVAALAKAPSLIPWSGWMSCSATSMASMDDPDDWEELDELRARVDAVNRRAASRLVDPDDRRNWTSCAARPTHMPPPGSPTGWPPGGSLRDVRVPVD